MKQLRIITFLLALITTLGLYAQSNYNDYDYGDKTSIFYDEFTDNENSWPTENGEIYYWYYKFRSTDEKQHAAGKPISINTSGDFEIELTIKLAQGPATKWVNLEWGWNMETSERFDFGFSQNAHTIDKFVNGAYQDYVNEANSSYVKNGDFNTLTVRKVGSTYYFFLNENLVHTMPFEPFFGNYIGFSVPAYSEVNVDKLKISTLASKGYSPSNNNNYTPSNYSSGSAFVDYNAVTKENIFSDNFDDNRNEWKIVNENNFERSIKNGALYLKSTTDKAKLLFKTAEFSEYRDWQIEASIKYLSGKDLGAHALIWGRGDDVDYGLYFTASGSWKISRYKDGYKDYNDYTDEPSMNKDGYNKYTIRKAGNSYIFFINGNKVYEMPYEAISGYQFGFQVNSYSEIAVDYVNIDYITAGGSNNNTPGNGPTTPGVPGVPNVPN
jgi:hypothetical protein